MEVNFCDANGGDVWATKESESLKDVLNSITRIGTEIHVF
ncbi:hypothetical protein BCD96_005714 [Clostridium beijerinckii]|nr:hypothetical protein [Clostridium beijerinckii]NRU41634.1 hypothetical protein [Clostridium beijerinckii]NSB00822.1 hypothetical protein [Clostridium beijerinckii]